MNNDQHSKIASANPLFDVWSDIKVTIDLINMAKQTLKSGLGNTIPLPDDVSITMPPTNKADMEFITNVARAKEDDTAKYIISYDKVRRLDELQEEARLSGKVANAGLSGACGSPIGEIRSAMGKFNAWLIDKMYTDIDVNEAYNITYPAIGGSYTGSRPNKKKSQHHKHKNMPAFERVNNKPAKKVPAYLLNMVNRYNGN